MNEILIIKSASVLVALERLENNSTISTLLVIEENQKLVGTLTDGDIRRYLIAGGQLSDKVINVCNKKFSYIRDGEDNVLTELKECKNKGIRVVPCLDAEGRITEVLDLMRYKSHLPIDAVLMAGGKGERLRPITEKIPKPLVKVGDKCIIDYNVDRLMEFGVKNINVTVNYLKEQLHEHFAVSYNGLKVKTIEEPRFLGTIGSIQFIKDFNNDYVLVMNSDLFTDIDFEDFFLHFREHDADMSIAAIPYNVSIPFGILDLDGRKVKGLLEKPKYNYYANGGIYLIKKSVLNLIPKDQFFNATDFIELLISLNKKVVRYPLNGTWIDIGQHADLVKAQDLVKHIRIK